MSHELKAAEHSGQPRRSELEPEVSPPPRRWLRVLLIMIGAMVALYVLAAVLLNLGPDGY